ncbi:MAG: FHA domain-containing protein [bacterium]|nr:FHA domain-containing protein [bacterium]
MSVKSLIGKVFGKKKPTDSDEPEIEHHEISFQSTIIESPLKRTGSVASGNEIDIYVHDEKIKVHKISTDTRIGRDPSQTDIAIPELIVSKCHCTLYLKDHQVFLKDNKSTNGTFVNGKQITEQQLEDNDMISLGRKGTVRIIFHKQQNIEEAGENNGNV